MHLGIVLERFFPPRSGVFGLLVNHCLSPMDASTHSDNTRHRRRQWASRVEWPAHRPPAHPPPPLKSPTSPSICAPVSAHEVGEVAGPTFPSNSICRLYNSSALSNLCGPSSFHQIVCRVIFRLAQAPFSLSGTLLSTPTIRSCPQSTQGEQIARHPAPPPCQPSVSAQRQTPPEFQLGSVPTSVVACSSSPAGRVCQYSAGNIHAEAG